MNRYIFVIDDSSTIRLSVEMAIRELGYPVMQAENGQDALDKIAEIKKSGDEIALCICDINMPVMNGIEFITAFREVDKFTPLIILSTENQQGIIQKGKNSGASGWIVKPFKTEDLLNVVRRFVK
ncbi:MAG: response regulator [Spirochaetota bacterium]